MVMASKYNLEMAGVDLEAVLYSLYVLGQRLAKVEEALGLPVGQEIMPGFVLGATEAEALDQMARDAGYDNWREAALVDTCEDDDRVKRIAETRANLLMKEMDE